MGVDGARGVRRGWAPLEVNQLLETFSVGDAIGNYVRALRRQLRAWGVRSEVFCAHRDPELSGDCRPDAELPTTPAAITILHYSLWAERIVTQFLRARGKRVLIYHNVTPDHFFAPYSPTMQRLCREGRAGLEVLRDAVDLAIADSEFNARDLRRLGFAAVATIPVPVDLGWLHSTPVSERTRDIAKSKGVNFLFVGRVAPNKRQEDVVRTFAWYRRFVEQRSHLWLVGSYAGLEEYANDVLSVARSLGVESHVSLVGRVPASDLVAYYRSASVFLCMSEHEGFCVPLVEAMSYDVPIVAYACPGVVETLGGVGLVLRRKDVPLAAEACDLVIGDEQVRAGVCADQRSRLESFDVGRTMARFETCLGDLT